MAFAAKGGTLGGVHSAPRVAFCHGPVGKGPKSFYCYFTGRPASLRSHAEDGSEAFFTAVVRGAEELILPVDVEKD